MIARDILNREIKPGQRVAYPVNAPSGLRLRLARVIESHPDMVSLQTVREDGSSYVFNFTRLDRIVIADGWE